jgi:hypothetical protein
MQRISGTTNTTYSVSIDRDTWRQLRDNVPAITAAVASKTGGVNMEAAGRAQYIHSQRVSAHYFDVLGIHLMLGRNFTDTEDTAGGPSAVVLSYGLWKKTFDGDANIVGKAIRLKGIPYTVIGVLPAKARTPAAVELWTSLRPDTSDEGGGDNFEPILRLRDGATWQQADAQLSQLRSFTSRYMEEKDPGSRISFYAVPLQQSLAVETRTPAMILMSAVCWSLVPTWRVLRSYALAAGNLRLLPASRSGQQDGPFCVNSGSRACC